MSKLFNITEEETNRILEMHNSRRTIQEQPISNWISDKKDELLNTDLGKTVQSYASNLAGQLPPYWQQLKNMNPKPTVKTSNLLQKTLGSSSEMLEWMNGESSLGVHSDGKVEIMIEPDDGLSGKQKKQMDAAESILRSIGLTANWKSLHEGQKYVELEKLNKNQILTLVNNASKYV